MTVLWIRRISHPGTWNFVVRFLDYINFFVFLFLASNGSIVPEGGSIIGGKCHVTGSMPAETVNLSLKVINLVRRFSSNYLLF